MFSETRAKLYGLVRATLGLVSLTACALCSRRLIIRHPIRPEASACFCENCLPPGIAELFSPWPRGVLGVFYEGENYGLEGYARCPTCGELNATTEVAQCLSCYILKLPIQNIRSLWYYEGSVSKIVQKLKYNRQSYLSNFFAEKLVFAARCPEFWGHSAVKTKWDMILPIPSTQSRLRQRGFAHLWFVARRMSNAMGIESSPYVISMKKSRSCQAGLTRAERVANSMDMFLLDRKKIVNKTILLIDDVITTGSTVFSAAQEIMAAGAISVDILSISRSVRFHDNLKWLAAQALRSRVKSQKIDRFAAITLCL